MLVLGRKESERIFIGNDIVITVVEIDRGKVKIGITAPRELPIHREEIHEAIKKQAAKAA